MKLKRKVASKKVPKRKAARPAKRKVQAVYQVYEEINYESAMAKNVLDQSAPLESEDAVALAAGLSSLTSSLKRLSYNYGMTVGRTVYKVFEGRKHYKWYGDSIQDIVLFFEKIGYNYILYKILTDNVEVSIYRKNKVRMGCNIHSFDAGVMAGFLGAARGDFVKVTETACCNNGAECCKFTTSGYPEDPFSTDIEGIGKLFDSAPSEGLVRQEYQVLLTQPLMRAQYAGQIGAILTHLGQAALKEPRAGKLSAKTAEKAGGIMSRFGLGKLDYAPRPLKIEILLDGVKAKKEFVDISISFLNGMIGRYFGKPLKSSFSPGRKGSYRIIMKQ